MYLESTILFKLAFDTLNPRSALALSTHTLTNFSCFEGFLKTLARPTSHTQVTHYVSIF